MKTIVVLVAAIAFTTLIQGASALSIEDGRFPEAKVGQGYFYQLHMRVGSGSFPLTWIVPHSGVFPPGLTSVVSQNTRTLTVLGVPTTPGTYNFYIQVRDAPQFSPCCTEVPYTITVAPAGPEPTTGKEAPLTEQQFPYTGPYYGPDTQNGKPKRKGNTAQALKIVMRELDYGDFPNPDKHYNRPLQAAMRLFQEDNAVRPTGDYGKRSWEEVREAHKTDGRLAANQVVRVLVNLENQN